MPRGRRKNTNKSDVPGPMTVEVMGIRTLYVNVTNCERCGDNHPGQEFKILTNPGKFTYYSSCPYTRQPVLISTKQLTDDGEISLEENLEESKEESKATPQ